MATQTFPLTLNRILAKVVGSSNDRELKRLRLLVDRVNDLEDEARRLTDDDLARTAEIFRERAKREGGLEGALDELMPEVFARVREAARRAIGMRHFDVQLIGGAVLHSGRIAEMGTGEGKTLAATLAASLNAIAGRGVHVVTVNDYLARRDAEWMGRVYEALGLTVGCIQRDMTDTDRQAAYAADITYGTSSELGFDYLRDNMKFDVASQVQRPYQPKAHVYAIVDEVDSILVDEARTPLIISGSSEESTDRYAAANAVVPRLRAYVDYEVDEKRHTAVLTEAGVERAEKVLGVGNLYDLENTEILHCLSQSVKAHTLYRRDKEYVVTPEGEVIIVDANTGRPMPGRRWSDGLHQAVEAKEGVKIEAESQTMATVTLQNYFRMYEKLSGMTGTAETEAAEFHKIYNLDVVVIPPNRSNVRVDHPDVIYRTLSEKWTAVADEIAEIHATGRPVLVGTVSVESSELLSRLLDKRGIRHHVLNAKHHEREAEIVAQAGRLGAVTIATNMAGRGTDILLGGTEALEHDDVVRLGGLAIIGTERHESRRIDNQLRGRAGRQGDPGSSRFFLSLEDDLMRIFAGDRMRALLKTLGMGEGMPIESKMVSKRIEGAQRAVEGQNFDDRKRTVEYDDVLNKQRETIYGLRRQLLAGTDQRERIAAMAGDVAEDAVERFLGGPEADPDAWDWEGLEGEVGRLFGVALGEVSLDRQTSAYEEVVEGLREAVARRYEAKRGEMDDQTARWLERNLYLQVLDHQWKDHLLAIDHLRHGIGLAGYAQKDPLVEFKRVGFQLFEAMTLRIETETIRILFNVEVQQQTAAAPKRR